jgi:uncharacterized protein YraI
METPGLEVSFLFRIVHDEVLEATAQQQEPFLYGSLGATPIYLVPPGETPVAATPSAESTQPSATSTASGARSTLMEADYLAAIRTNTEEAYRAFLEKHPNSAREAQVNSLIAALVENDVWSEVSDEDTVAAYRRYLAAFPEGAYAAEARTRMDHLFEERRQLASRTPETPSAPASACGHPHGDYRVVGIASDDVLWVRSSPRRDANETGSIPPNGDGVGVGRCTNVSGYSFQWCEVRYRCVSGWAYARYLEEGGASTATTEGETYRVFGIAPDDVLNMREGPGTAYPIVTEIPPDGRGIEVSHCAATGSANKWCQIDWQGMSGWASSCCLAGEQSGLRPN